VTGQTATATERVWMNTRQAAEYAGVDPSTLWRARQRGELKAGGVGRAVRFERAELDRWLRGGAQVDG
jgi:excisionase family DNA binding protein